jgi:hypothetical protein
MHLNSIKLQKRYQNMIKDKQKYELYEEQQKK